MARCLVLLATLGAPLAAAALPSRPIAHLRLGGALQSISGTSVEATVGVSAAATLVFDGQIGVGVLGTTSRHTVRPSFDAFTLSYLAAVTDWRLDVLSVVPLLEVGLGVLRLRTEGEPAAHRPAYHLGLCVDWWIARPLSGPALGLEVRYLGLVTSGLFPVAASFGVRLGYAF